MDSAASGLETGSIRSAALGVAWAARSTSRLTMRPCGPEPLSVAKLEPELAREPPRQRRGEDAGRVTVAAVPPDLLGDLVHHLLGGQRPLPLRDGRKSALLGVRTLCLGVRALGLILRSGRRPRLEG